MRPIGTLVALGALMAAGCGPSEVSLRRGPRSYGPSDYEKVLERWTRTGRIFDHFDTNLKATATYFSWDFLHAYAMRWAHMFHLPKAEARRFKRKLLADTKDFCEFYLAVTTQELRWNDLDHEQSIWQVRLITDRGTQIAPMDIKRINPVTATLRAMFPYTKTFYYAYRVRFAANLSGRRVIEPGLHWFGLRLSGPKGTLTLKWKTKR